MVSLFPPRPASRRKPDPAPVSDTGEAQKKFGDSKSISSDMFFGKQDNSEVGGARHAHRLPSPRPPVGSLGPVGGPLKRGRTWGASGVPSAVRVGPRVWFPPAVLAPLPTPILLPISLVPFLSYVPFLSHIPLLSLSHPLIVSLTSHYCLSHIP